MVTEKEGLSRAAYDAETKNARIEKTEDKITKKKIIFFIVLTAIGALAAYVYFVFFAKISEEFYNKIISELYLIALTLSKLVRPRKRAIFSDPPDDADTKNTWLEKSKRKKIIETFIIVALLLFGPFAVIECILILASIFGKAFYDVFFIAQWIILGVFALRFFLKSAIRPEPPDDEEAKTTWLEKIKKQITKRREAK